MADEKPDLPEYERPEMDFEREASFSPGAGTYAGIGIEFAVYVVLFFLGGKWLDGKFGWEPWGAALGGLFGAMIGMTMLIRRVMRASKADEKSGKPPHTKGS